MQQTIIYNKIANKLLLYQNNKRNKAASIIELNFLQNPRWFPFAHWQLFPTLRSRSSKPCNDQKTSLWRTKYLRFQHLLCNCISVHFTSCNIWLLLLVPLLIAAFPSTFNNRIFYGCQDLFIRDFYVKGEKMLIHTVAQYLI